MTMTAAQTSPTPTPTMLSSTPQTTRFHASKPKLAIAAAALVLISIHAAISLLRTLRRRRAKGAGAAVGLERYADRDGVATAESVRRYTTRWQTVLAAFCAAAGVCVSLARAVLLTLDGEAVVLAWLTCALWVSFFGAFLFVRLRKFLSTFSPHSFAILVDSVHERAPLRERMKPCFAPMGPCLRHLADWRSSLLSLTSAPGALG